MGFFDKVKRSSNSNKCEELFKKGQELFQKGKPEEGWKYYGKALQMNCSHYSCWMTRGGHFFIQGDYPESIICYEKARDIDEQRFEAWQNIGSSFKKMGDCKNALNYYNKAIERNAKSATCWYLKGECLQMIGRNDDALKCYDKSINLDLESMDDFPELWLALNNKGSILLNNKDYMNASNLFKKSIEINKDSGNLKNYGLSLFFMGKYSDALKSFEEVLKFEKNDKVVNEFIEKIKLILNKK